MTDAGEALPANPFRITGPALISFSGGRTSAYMLKQIIDAHCGVLPDDVHVCFANTGKEREETLRFVHECSTRWSVRIHWLEWRARKGEIEARFEEVGFNSASREGEPFWGLIKAKSYLPNSQMRFCTDELKIKVMKHFMVSLGYKKWTNVIGLRADEMHRVDKSLARSKSGKERWRTTCPLAKVGVRAGDVFSFFFGDHIRDMANIDWDALLEIPWPSLPQGFDLGLRPFEGNCDGCFLKGRGKLYETERRMPGTLSWWDRAEQLIGARVRAKLGPFRKQDRLYYDDDDLPVYGPWYVHWPQGGTFRPEWNYAELIEAVHRQPDLFESVFDDDPEMDAECGTWCAGEVA